MSEVVNRAAEIQAMHKGSIVEQMGIEYQLATPDKLIATMRIGPHNHQPRGIVHGGVSVTLAESLASIGAFLNVDPEKFQVMGLEINANHVRAKSDGVVTAEAIPLHRGRTTQIWDIKIRDEEGRLTCVSRCTIAVVPRKDGAAQ